MKKLFKNTAFIAILIILLLIIVFAFSPTFRKRTTGQAKPLLEIIQARLASIEALPQDSEWYISIREKAANNSITFRQQALIDIAFVLQNSFAGNGIRMYTDNEIREAIQDKYDFTAIPV